MVDLSILPGEVPAQVLGSSLYRVKVRPLAAKRWQALVKRCHGEVDSLVDLLRGNLSPIVMQALTVAAGGVLPEAGDLSISCTCPDGASLCKHVAAALYTVGARLDSDLESPCPGRT